LAKGLWKLGHFNNQIKESWGWIIPLIPFGWNFIFLIGIFEKGPEFFGGKVWKKAKGKGSLLNSFFQRKIIFPRFLARLIRRFLGRK